MYLHKSKRSPYYQIIYFQGGKRTSLSTKETKKSEALKFLIEFKDRVKHKKSKQPITLDLFYSNYKETVSLTLSSSYLRNIQLAFDMLRARCGNPLLEDISLRMVEDFIFYTYKRTKTGAFLYYRNLKAAFNKAIGWGYLAENPFVQLKFPKLAKTYPVFINESELEKILGKVESDLLKDVYLTLFHTGIRAGELINLKWDQVNLADKTLMIRNTEQFTTKGKKDRIIPINDKLLRVLHSRVPKIMKLDQEQFVFTRIPGIRLTVDHLSKKFKQAVRLAGMNDKIHLHTLRHSFASNLAQRGVSLYVIKELLGHEDLKTTQIYSHLQHQNLVDAVDLLN